MTQSYLIESTGVALNMLFTGDAETYTIINTTLQTAGIAIFFALTMGVPLGFFCGYYTFKGKSILKVFFETSLSFPTVVIGLLVYLLLSRVGPLGELGLLFTIPGMSLGLTVLGLPIVVTHTWLATERADAHLKDTLLSLGANKWQLLKTTLFEVRYHLVLAAVMAFGRIISEVGITMMVGGNMKGHTRTLTTAISLETNKGDYSLGIALGIVLLLLALLLNIIIAVIRKQARV